MISETSGKTTAEMLKIAEETEKEREAKERRGREGWKNFFIVLFTILILIRIILLK